MSAFTKFSVPPVLPLLLLLAPMLTGCDTLFGREGFLRDKGDDYLRAQSIPPITVPAEMKKNVSTEIFVIPPITSTAVIDSEDFEAPRPPQGGETNVKEVKIQRMQERQWIVINRAPDQVWPAVRAFLDSQTIGIDVLDTENGVMETEWLLAQGEPGFHDRYRIVLEQGMQPSSTEVFITELTVPSSVSGGGQVNWPKVSTNVEREHGMLMALSKIMAADSANAVSMVGQTVGVKQKVNMQQNPPALLLAVDMDRAWASVGLALTQNGFNTLAVEEMRHVYHVTWQAPTQVQIEKPGFFARVLPWNWNKQGAKNKTDYGTYDVLLQQQGDAITVLITDPKGQALPQEKAERLMRIIRGALG